MTPPRPIFVSLITALLLAPSALAQQGGWIPSGQRDPVIRPRIAPPPPALYDAVIRYQIRVGGNRRILQFYELEKFLDAVGFKRIASDDPNEPIDADADRIYGTLPSKRLSELLLESHIRTVLLTPAGYKLPENPDQRVLVQIKLAEGLSPNRQRDLFFQTLDKLIRLGLVEKIGYDHEHFTRILGTLPAGDVDLLVRDLRFLPAGWLTSATPVYELPDPIRDVTPIRVAEVLAEPEGVPPNADVPLPSSPPAGQESLAKIAPDLRAAVADNAANAVRFEVVITQVPPLEDMSWQALFTAQAGLTIEGRLGPVVSVLAPIAVARSLTALPDVATVRPPRAATRQQVASPATSIATPALLAATGLDRLHALNYRGAGFRVAVIDADFSGLAARLGKELPKDTPHLDLTAARNYNLQPDPIAEGAEPGRGTRLALAVKLAAPDVQLVLIRVDPAAMYQLLTVARYTHGDVFRPENLVNRNRELLADNDDLRVQRAKLTEERAAMATEFSQEDDIIKKRQELEARTVALAQREDQFNDRLARFFALEAGLIDLRKVSIVACPLAWDEGYAFDGSAPLSRYLDDVFYGRPRSKILPPTGRAIDANKRAPALWFQATGNTRGQVWNGPLLDTDSNGVFQFAPSSRPLPKDRWTNELNFLAWQLTGGERSFDLPAGTKVRLTFQWTEAHDPAVSAILPPDLYRTPLTNLHLLVLRQRDPNGTKVASDDLNVIARTDALPQLIERQPSWATYEHVIEFTPDAAGRFALRIEGAVPPSTRPDTVASVPAVDRQWELHGRLFVSATGSDGRVVIGDYQPGLGGLGSPGNALLPRTIGAADATGRPQPYSACGSPSGQVLMVKPTFLAFDELALPSVAAGAGSEQATAFAAGMYASMMSAGTIEAQKLSWLGLPPSGLLRVPPDWLNQVERRWPKTGRE
jgi:hypothetical protein